jgi:peroxin-5
MFSAAVNQFPKDAELHVALGVLHHLGRQFSAAISSFEAALQVR